MAKFARILMLLCSLGLAPGLVRAEANCFDVEPDSVEIDGLADDTFSEAFEASQRGTLGSPDGSSWLFCGIDGQSLHLWVFVPRAVSKFALSVRAPGGPPLKLKWRPSSRRREGKLTGARGIEALDSAQSNGWSFEARIPYAKIAAFGAGIPELAVQVTHSAKRAKSRTDTHVRRMPASLAAERALVSKLGARPRLAAVADVDPGVGAEKVLMIGRAVGVVGDGYTFFRLPVESAEDFLAMKVVDLLGTGQHVIVVHYRQRGASGSRELLQVLKVTATGFESLAIFEIAKALAGRSLVNKWAIVTNKRGGGAVVVETGDPVGWTADTYRETPASDAVPITLPWPKKRRVRHSFDAGGYVGAKSTSLR